MRKIKIPKRQGGEILPNIAKKEELVQEIREKVERAASVVLVNARGLTVLQDTNLRRSLREAGVDYKVYKNTMINFAIKGTTSEPLAPHLHGPTAMAFSYDEATKAASIINKSRKDMPKLEFKAGVVDGVLYDADGMVLIADIPSREVLLSRLLGSLQSPIASFARVINALAEEKGGGGGGENSTNAEPTAPTEETAEQSESPKVEVAETPQEPPAETPAAETPAEQPTEEPAKAEPPAEETAEQAEPPAEPAAEEPAAEEKPPEQA